VFEASETGFRAKKLCVAATEEIDRPAHQFTAVDYIAIATITEALFSYLRNA